MIKWNSTKPGCYSPAFRARRKGDEARSVSGQGAIPIDDSQRDEGGVVRIGRPLPIEGKRAHHMGVHPGEGNNPDRARR